MDEPTKRKLPRRLCRFAGLAAASALLLIGAPAALFSQDAGRVMGRVTDARTGAPLQSVQVVIEDPSRGTLTDAQGRFIFLDVPAGTRIIKARSIGYGAATVASVEVPPGTAVTVDIVLEPAAVELEGITVSTERQQGSTGALLSERRIAADVSDAIGAEQISRAPDGDVAAALKRVPGVTVVDGKYVYIRGLGERYGATTLNGAPMPSPLPDRKAVPLDVIPSDLLESVVTSKSYTPDQPGDYAGGLVQIRTRDVPTSRTLQLSASTGYNTTTSFRSTLGFTNQGGMFGLGGPDGTLPSSIFQPEAVRLPSEAGARNEFAHAITSRFAAPLVERPLNRSYGITYGDRLHLLGRTLGLIGTVTTSESFSSPESAVERSFVAAGDEPRQSYDFAVTGGSRETSLGGLASASLELTPEQKITVTGNYNRLTDDQARMFTGLYSGGDYFETHNTRFVASSIATGQLRGQHTIAPLGNISIDWRASYGRAERDEPGTRNVAYRGAEAGGPVYFQPSQSSGSVLAQRLDENLYSGAVDLKIPFALGSRDASFAVGGAGDIRDRDVQTRRILLTPVDNIGGAAHLPPNELFVPERIGEESGQLTVADRSFAADDYVAEQSITALYSKLDFEPVPRLRLVAGVRVEQATQDVEVTGFRGNEAQIPSARLDDTDIIPAVNLTYAVADGMNLRAAISRTVGRPQFRELSPFLYADYFGDTPVRGNPFLVRSRITNADLRWEWFFDYGALLSVSAFHKSFTDPIEPIAIMLGTNPGKTFANTESATITGAEFEARIPVGALVLNGNLTLARSVVGGDEVLIYDPQSSEPLAYPVVRGEGRPLFGQSPYAVNIGATYDHERSGTSATLLFNRFGRRVDTTGGVQLPDIYEEGRSQLDLTVEQDLPGGFALKAAATRLLGGDVLFTQAFPNGDKVTTRGYDLGRTFSMSLSWKP